MHKVIKDFFAIVLVSVMLLAIVPVINAYTTDEIVQSTVEFIISQEGAYSTVDPNESGAVSMGILGWRATRALNLLKEIVDADKSSAEVILGENLYNEIVMYSTWNTRTLTAEEATRISQLLGTSFGKTIQDTIAIKDVTRYITDAQNRGILNAGALLMYADVENQCGGAVSYVIGSYAAGSSGAFGEITLDDMYQAAMNNSTAGRYPARRKAGYDFAKKRFPDSSSSVEDEMEIETGTLVTFGSYPQTSVVDEDLLTVLNAQTLNWIYYNYYCDGVQEDYMKYADVTYSGQRYRAVTFSHYRPNSTTESLDYDNESQDENGYEPGMVYWFKFDPIVWRVLDARTGLLITEHIIDSQPFHNIYYVKDGHSYSDANYTHYASNWAYSSLRRWMNEDFYNTAFDEVESYIKETSLSTTSPYSSSNDSSPTIDKVFPLTSADASNNKYGFISNYDKGEDTNRIAYGTDYARSQGLFVDGTKGQYYSDASFWRLRTPYNNITTSYVGYPGNIHDYVIVNDTYLGIRPAMYINLQTGIADNVIKHTDDSGLVINGPLGIPSDELSGDIVPSDNPVNPNNPSDGDDSSGGKTDPDDSAGGNKPAEYSLLYFERKEPTCLDDGNIDYYYCEETDKYYKDKDAIEEIAQADTILPATGVHTWDEGTISVEPSCVEYGLKMYICTVCGEAKSEVIPKTEHTLERVHNPSTCTVKGVDYDVCTNDGDENIYNYTVLDLLPHPWDEGVVTVPATVKNEGVITYTCTVCGTTKTESIPKLDKCVHEWNDGEATVAATCVDDGVMTYTCAICGETKTEVIPATGAHTFGKWTFTAVPTYREGGRATRTCSVCGYVEEKLYDRVIPDYTEHDDPTGVEIGYMKDTYGNRIELEVTNIFDGDSFNFLNKEKGNFDFKIYDIKTKFEDAAVQPNGTVLVKFPIPTDYDRSKLRIYHVTNTGTVEKMDMWIDGDYACFEASHFSAYALVDESKSNVPYGDVNMDGKVLADDARLALRASAQLETLDIVPTLVADVDGNGSIFADDARQILRFSAKLQSAFERVPAEAD